MYRHSLLTLRACLLSAGLGAFLSLCLTMGWATTVFTADQTGVVYIIAALFCFGLYLAHWRLRQFTAALDWLGGYKDAPPFTALRFQGSPEAESALRGNLAARIGTIRWTGNGLVTLGLIGTVLGFIIALSGVDPSTAGDISKVPVMIGTLVEGMSTALYTTLLGAVLALWLSAYTRMLESAAAHIMSAFKTGAE